MPSRKMTKTSVFGAPPDDNAPETVSRAPAREGDAPLTDTEAKVRAVARIIDAVLRNRLTSGNAVFAITRGTRAKILDAVSRMSTKGTLSKVDGVLRYEAPAAEDAGAAE